MTTRTATLLAPFFLLSAPALQAQSFQPLANCECPAVRLDDAYCFSELVFEGTPSTTDTVYARSATGKYMQNSIDHVNSHFRVTHTWKGPGGGMAEVATFHKLDECGYRFIIGDHYLVFAHSLDGMMVTDRCTPTRAMDTIGPSFRDSLTYVSNGHRWPGPGPEDSPCR